MVAGLGRTRLQNVGMEATGGWLSFYRVQAGWHLTNTLLSPAQIRYKQGMCLYAQGVFALCGAISFAVAFRSQGSAPGALTRAL